MKPQINAAKTASNSDSRMFPLLLLSLKQMLQIVEDDFSQLAIRQMSVDDAPEQKKPNSRLHDFIQRHFHHAPTREAVQFSRQCELTLERFR